MVHYVVVITVLGVSECGLLVHLTNTSPSKQPTVVHISYSVVLCIFVVGIINNHCRFGNLCGVAKSTTDWKYKLSHAFNQVIFKSCFFLCEKYVLTYFLSLQK